MFDKIAALANSPDEMFQQAARQLVEAGQLHRLFDLRLMQRRHDLGLPLGQDSVLDELEDSLLERLEKGYLDACREVGQLFLEAGQPREAWRYLRPTGERKAVRRWLERAVPDEATADELIELALYEGIDPERGYAWLLARRGTCNAVTELEAMRGGLSVKHQSACAAVLVRHMHQELLTNLREHLQRLGETAPSKASVSDLLTEHPALLAEGAFHVDTSHLATTVRFARLLTEPALLEKAIELAEYGSRLAADLQYPDEAPFEDLYRTHLLLFRGSLGREVEAALDYFRGRARATASDDPGATAIEAYLVLLERTGRAAQALEEYAELVPKDHRLSPYAPTQLRLAQACGDWQRYFELCQVRGDVVGFAAGQWTQRARAGR
jgi:hypothetical protein